MTHPDHVVQLKPQLENSFSCPECHTEQPTIREVLIQPVCEMADCQCRKCGLAFYQSLPVGHTAHETISVSKASGKVFGSETSWLSGIAQQISKLSGKEKFTIKKRVFRDAKNVVILNTLDFLYGHVLLKLLNAENHLSQHKGLGLIVIVPKSFEWLIPSGCAETWVVHGKLNDFRYGYEAIQTFIKQQMVRFDKVYLSKAYSHPDLAKIDIARFTGVRPFNLQRFHELTPTITVILREDRWWFTNILDYWTYRVCRKFKLQSLGNKFLSWRQNCLVKKTIKEVQQKLPSAECIIVGLGKTGMFGNLAKDMRQTDLNSTIESDWCRVYARSHVVVGVHGSNMLLPTGLSAGCVEILPVDRYPNIVQDISSRYNDRRQLFFYRFADQYAKPASVAEKIVSIVRDYESFNRNMNAKPRIHRTFRQHRGRRHDHDLSSTDR
jgi:hypothetical protein